MRNFIYTCIFIFYCYETGGKGLTDRLINTLLRVEIQFTKVTKAYFRKTVLNSSIVPLPR